MSMPDLRGRIVPGMNFISKEDYDAYQRERGTPVNFALSAYTAAQREEIRVLKEEIELALVINRSLKVRIEELKEEARNLSGMAGY